jgi:uncharacterized repeat protein (TIGR02543 family)
MKARSELVGDQLPANDEITGTFAAEAPLNGSYTVGAGGTYSTLTQAVSKLNSLGVSGPVTINLLENLNAPETTETYPITINSIPGASSTNTVTIKPNAPGITMTGSSASALVILNGSDWVTIDGSSNGTSSRDMTMTNTNTGTSSAVIWLQTTAGADAATNNVVKNLNLVGNSNTTTLFGVGSGGTTISVTSLGTGNNNNTFQNNNISKTQYGIYSQGASAANKNTGTVITQNLINTASPNNVRRAGVYVGFENNIQITQNTIDGIQSATSIEDVFGISTGTNAISTSSFAGNEVTNATISRNFIGTVKQTATYSACGIFITSAATGTNVISNNIISGVFADGTSGDFSSGILIGGGTGTTQIYFNSISMSTPAGAPTDGSDKSYCIAIGGSNPIVDMRDNILSNTQSVGTTVNYDIGYGYSTFTNLTSDYNDFFNTVNATHNVGGTASISAPTAQVTFANLQAATGKDANSKNVDPVFTSASDLHLQGSTTLGAMGITIAGIAIDFDGQTRANPPYIGADELPLSPGTLQFSSATYSVTEIGMTATITVTRAGGSQGAASVMYSTSDGTATGGAACGGTTDYITASGTLNWADGDAASKTFTVNVCNDGVSEPNETVNLALANATGATLGTPNTAVLTIVNSEAYNGTYNVGSGGNFGSLTAAVAALSNGYLTGPVVLNLTENATTPGAPDAMETYPITINPITGASSTNTIKIKPNAAGTTMTGSSATALIVLNGADWVIIDGSSNGTSSRDLTMTNTNAGTASALIWLQTNGADGATNNVVKNLNLVGSANTQTLVGAGSGSTVISLTSFGTGNNNNRFQNNNISKTQVGIYSGGASAVTKNTGTVITQNVMNTASPNNIQVGGVLVNFEDGVQITNNTISGISSTASGVSAFGIALGVRPSNNNTTFTGNDVTNAVVTGNTIGTVAQTATYSAFGIVVNTVSSGTTLVANNMLSGVGQGTTATPSDFTAGILAGGGTGSTTQIYFNSVSMSGSSTATSPSYALAIGFANPIVDVRDNIFVNTQTAGKSYAIGTISSTFTNMTSNNNDLFVSGANAFVGQTGGLGTAGTDRSNLAAWQGATGTDANSISANPGFVSGTNLHLATSPIPPVSAAGVTIGGITTDIDGDTRQSPPDIGADEITTYTLTYTADANGSITGTTPQTVIAGGSGTAVTAVPNMCYHFVMWSDGSTANPRTDTNVMNNITVQAQFAINTYTLTYTADANGTIMGTTPQTVNCGASGSAVTAVPNACYHFVMWSDGSTANPRTDTNVMGDITVQAQFAINTYTLTYTTDGNGTIMGTTPQTVNCGASGTAVTAVPNTCYHFVMWSDGSTANPRTDSNVMGDITVQAQFAINTYTLTYTAGANGSISGTSPQMVSCGGSGSPVTAVPNSCYHFVNWSDGSTANPRTDMNVMGNISVTANFAINTYTLTYTAGANGSVTGTSPQTVNCGSDGSAVTAVPNTGYHFVNWSDGSTQNPRTDTNVQADISVTANFAINMYSMLYNGNGNTGGTAPVDPNSPYNHGSTVTVLGQGTLVRAGYTFSGWNTAANGTGTAYQPNDTFTITADTTLFAQWTVIPSCTKTVLPTDGSTSGNARCPEARFATSRAHYLITAAELAAAGYTNGAVPTSIGWHYSTAPGVVASAPLKIYMENTTDTVNNKSATWATAISTMTVVHNATTTLPNTTAPFDVTLSGGSSFTYTGGGLYVAYDWGTYTGTLSTTAVIACNTALVNGLKGANSNAATVVASSFRPETRLNGAVLMNDAAVSAVYSLGEIPYCLVPSQVIKATITNNGTNTLTNLPVTLTITGVDNVMDTQTIASLAPCGGQAVVTFTAYTPSALGSDTVTVTIPADDLNTNNSLSHPLNNTQLNYSYKYPGTTATGGVGVAGATASLAAKMTTTAANAVTAVKLEFPAVNAGTYRVAIYADSGSGTPGAQLYLDAADRTITAAGPVTITLPSPVAVGPGNFFVGINQTNTTNIGLSFDAETPIRSGAFYLAIPIGGAWFDEAPGNNFKLNIGAIMATGCPGNALTYDGNGNTGGTPPVDPNSPYNYNASVTVLGPGSLVRTGYTFTHWNTAADGSGTSYNPGQMFNITANTTLFAQWIGANADLSNLVPSQGALNPAFMSNITSYTDSVGNAVSSMTVTPTAADPMSTITVNGMNVPSGMPSQVIPLAQGNTPISVVVTAADMMTTKTYTVTVHRTPSVANGNDSGAGSLRQALANSQDGDVITFGGFLAGTDAHPAPDVPLSTVTLTSGELVVSTSVTIMGTGANNLTVTRDGMAPQFRIFHVVPGKTVTISGMTISNGNITGLSYPAGAGGGVYNDHSSVTLSGCAISGNNADYGGAAMNDSLSSGSATMNVDGCLFNGNAASFGGGGLYNASEAGGNAAMTVNNSTFSGNTGSNAGGAIINDASASGGPASLQISNSTLSGNSSPVGGGIFSYDVMSSVHIGNSILKKGAAGGNFGVSSGGTITSHGYNLSDDNGGGFLTGAGDQVNTDPMLGPLKNNGGPTATHAPLINSPALDQGNRNAIPALTTNVDQRGLARPVNDTAVPNAAGGDGSDIGAVEVQQFVHPTTANSSKMHDGAGTFGIDLPVTTYFANTVLGIECRSGGATGVYQVIINFAGNVSYSSAAVNGGTGMVSSSSGSGSNQITLNLTGVTNAQRITLALFDANDGSNTADVGLKAGILLGDIDGSGMVNATDKLMVQSAIGQAVSGMNFRSDVNTNGAINSTDKTITTSKSGTGLP